MTIIVAYTKTCATLSALTGSDVLTQKAGPLGIIRLSMTLLLWLDNEKSMCCYIWLWEMFAPANVHSATNEKYSIELIHVKLLVTLVVEKILV